jgi:site-specific DNA recombinase
MTTTCALYARKSTAQDVSDDAKSVTLQLARGRAFAEGKGWRVVDEFADDAVSGALTSRLVGRARMLAAAADGKFSVVIVRDFDRLSRDDREANVVYALEDCGITVWCYSDLSRVDTRTALNRGMLSMKATFAAAEREAASSRTHEALRAKAARGHVPNGVCFGYQNVREGDHSVRTIVPDEAAVIVKIFEMAAAGQGYLRIARALNAAGAPAPAPRRPGRRPSWSRTTVHDVLMRESYRGRIVWNKRQFPTRKGRCVVVRRPESEWITRVDESLRIVPEALWTAAHTRLGATRTLYAERSAVTPRGRTIPGTDSPYLLAGFLTCGACGGTMFAHRHGHQNREFFAYRCTAYHVRGRAVCSNGLDATMPLADESVLAAVEHDLLNVAVLETSLAKALALQTEPPDDGRVRTLRTDLARLDREVTNLTAAIAAGKPLESLLARSARHAHGPTDRRGGPARDVARRRRPGAAGPPLAPGRAPGVHSPGAAGRELLPVRGTRQCLADPQRRAAKRLQIRNVLTSRPTKVRAGP